MPLVEDLPYPTSTDTPDVPRDVQALATAVSVRTVYRAASGKTGSVPVSGTLAVVFPVGLFTQIPTVVVSPHATAIPNAVVQAYASNVTVNGFTVLLHLSTALAGGAWNAGVDWVATQDNP